MACEIGGRVLFVTRAARALISSARCVRRTHYQCVGAHLLDPRFFTAQAARKQHMFSFLHRRTLALPRSFRDSPDTEQDDGFGGFSPFGGNAE